MNRTMLCLAIYIIIVSLSIGQERRDVVYLKNGDVIKGIIVENVFNDYVRIELMGGSILSYKYVDIEKIIKEQANPPQIPSKTIRKSQESQLNQKIIPEDTLPKNFGPNLIGGINFSTVTGDDVNDADNLTGFRFGIEWITENGPIFGLTYSQRGFSVSSDDYKMDMKFNYLTGYVLFRHALNQNVNLLAGPELGVFLRGKLEEKDCSLGSCNSDTEDIDGDDWDDAGGSKVDIGFVLGLRFSINEQISLVGTYYMAFTNLGDEDFLGHAKNNSFQINISYGLK